MPNILDLPLAKRPIKLDDYNIDLDAAVEVDIVWGDYVMDIRAANVVLAKFYDSEIEEYFSGREKAINPWLSVADAVEKGFDFSAQSKWQVMLYWFDHHTGNRTSEVSYDVVTPAEMLERDTSWYNYKAITRRLTIVAFKPFDWSDIHVVEACKRIEVWNG